MSATQSPKGASSLANPAILDAVQITKQFGGLTAVNDVTFTLPERSIVSIIGPNGAGKTTFFNMLTGFYRPTFGADRVRRAQRHRRAPGHRHEGRNGADVPEHPPVRDHDGGRERDDRRALADARGPGRLDPAHAARAA